MGSGDITLFPEKPRQSAPDGAVVTRMRWPVSAYGRSLEDDVVGALARHFWSRQGGTREDAWLADGLAEYTRARVMEAMFPDGRPFELRLFGGFVPYAVRDIPAPTGPDPSNRAALVLLTLERYIGWPAVEEALSDFAPEWRRGAGRAELIGDINRAAGRDLSWFYAAAFDAGATYDFSIGELTSEATAHGQYRTTVVARRLGSAPFPGTAALSAPFGSRGAIGIDVTFAGGALVHEQWDGREDSVKYTYESHSPAVSAAIDPDDVIALDIRRENNRRDLSAGPAAGRWKPPLRWLAWVQDLLLTYSSFI